MTTLLKVLVALVFSHVPVSPVLPQPPVHKLASALEKIVPSDAVLEKIGEGFDWAEGPVWVPDGQYLLFSDIPRNTIYKWHEKEGLSIYLRPAGHAGSDPPGIELGSNGLLLDAEGTLTMCDHGNRCMSKLNSKDFTKKTLVSRYRGKRLNSPNDAVFKSNGDLYFTDPPYGLKGLNQDPNKELDFSGVYLFKTDGQLILLTREMTFPNGIAFSPDEETLYVSNSDPEHAVWMAFDVADDGNIQNGRVFFDATEWAKSGQQGLPDGMTVDQGGNIFATGPGGVHVFTPEGTHLGTIKTGQIAANCTFGNDGSVLYITADSHLYRIRLNTTGLGF